MFLAEIWKRNESGGEEGGGDERECQGREQCMQRPGGETEGRARGSAMELGHTAWEGKGESWQNPEEISAE